MGDAVLELEDITKRYGDFLAVDRVSFTAPKGKILGLLGPNGAGKTSTLRMILGITQPDKGSITVFGKPPGQTARPRRPAPPRLPA
jgi:ABC-2 type transport system ATP-binding protein